jgi:hypothetical protein
MNVRGRSFAIAMAIGSLLVVGLTGTSAASAATPHEVGLTYSVSSMQKGSTLTILYEGGIVGNDGGSAQARGGALSFIHFLGGHSFELSASGSGSLTADATEDVQAAGGTITGVADVPSGATVKLRDDVTNQLIDLPNGPFSINSGAGLSGMSSAHSSETRSCQGDAGTCTADVNIAGAAGSRTVTINLLQDDLVPESVKANGADAQTAFDLSDGHLAAHGSEYVVDVNTVRWLAPGSDLALSFTRESGSGQR